MTYRRVLSLQCRLGAGQVQWSACPEPSLLSSRNLPTLLFAEDAPIPSRRNVP